MSSHKRKKGDSSDSEGEGKPKRKHAKVDNASDDSDDDKHAVEKKKKKHSRAKSADGDSDDAHSEDEPQKKKKKHSRAKPVDSDDEDQPKKRRSRSSKTFEAKSQPSGSRRSSRARKVVNYAPPKDSDNDDDESESDGSQDPGSDDEYKQESEPEESAGSESDADSDPEDEDYETDDEFDIQQVDMTKEKLDEARIKMLQQTKAKRDKVHSDETQRTATGRVILPLEILTIANLIAAAAWRGNTSKASEYLTQLFPNLVILKIKLGLTDAEEHVLETPTQEEFKQACFGDKPAIMFVSIHRPGKDTGHANVAFLSNNTVFLYEPHGQQSSETSRRVVRVLHAMFVGVDKVFSDGSDEAKGTEETNSDLSKLVFRTSRVKKGIQSCAVNDSEYERLFFISAFGKCVIACVMAVHAAMDLHQSKLNVAQAAIQVEQEMAQHWNPDACSVFLQAYSAHVCQKLGLKSTDKPSQPKIRRRYDQLALQRLKSNHRRRGAFKRSNRKFIDLRISSQDSEQTATVSISRDEASKITLDDAARRALALFPPLGKSSFYDEDQQELVWAQRAGRFSAAIKSYRKAMAELKSDEYDGKSGPDKAKSAPDKDADLSDSDSEGAKTKRKRPVDYPIDTPAHLRAEIPLLSAGLSSRILTDLFSLNQKSHRIELAVRSRDPKRLLGITLSLPWRASDSCIERDKAKARAKMTGRRVRRSPSPPKDRHLVLKMTRRLARTCLPHGIFDGSVPVSKSASDDQDKEKKDEKKELVTATLCLVKKPKGKVRLEPVPDTKPVHKATAAINFGRYLSRTLFRQPQPVNCLMRRFPIRLSIDLKNQPTFDSKSAAKKWYLNKPKPLAQEAPPGAGSPKEEAPKDVEMAPKPAELLPKPAEPPKEALPNGAPPDFGDMQMSFNMDQTTTLDEEEDNSNLGMTIEFM